MDNETVTLWTFIGILVIACVLLAWLTLSTLSWLREKNMKQLAKDFGLFYDGSASIKIPNRPRMKALGWYIGYRKNHVLTGTIKKHSIKIFDLHWHGPRSVHRETTCLVDGKKVSLPRRHFLVATVPTRKIRAFLESL